ncbi:MAG: hypothetical protein M1820_007878 [Bogoriella megaspora]|nr:MAG: hypothetical protein M1820_007878 [Bogoriella megaspora]
MSKATRKKAYIYPAWCFSASPTYNTWVKFTAADVHRLQKAKGGFEGIESTLATCVSIAAAKNYKGQKLYFWINHPIRFVRLVGPIIAIDDVNPRYTIITIDDGSGATISLKIIRRSVEDEDNPVDCPNNTEVPNMNIVANVGTFELVLDGTLLDIGTVVKAKGRLEEFRGVKQLELKRLSIVESTDEEAQAWAELAKFRKAVLSKPWHLSKTEIEELKEESAEARRKKEAAVREKREQHAQKEAKYREYLERKRQHEIKRDRWLAKMEEKMSTNALDRQKPINP